MTTLHRASARRSGADILALLGLGLGFSIALATAGRHLPLARNPHVLAFVALDAVLVLYLAAALGVCQRRRTLGAALALVIAVGLLASSCAKILVLGEPGFAADFLLLPDLLHVLPPLLAWAGALAGGLLAALYLGNFGLPRSRREAWLLAPLLAAITAIAAIKASPGVAAAAAQALPVQARGYPVFGHFYSAYGGFVRDADWAHQLRALRGEAGDPGGQVPLGRAPIPPFAPRNVHLVVVESLTDPAWYPAFDLDVALPPLLERWREDGSRALSPVFGNRSSNAEFELLCGVPAIGGPSEVVFWRLAAAPLPCLPRRLAELGYTSISLVPSAAEIFNAGEAYRAIGFDRSLFDRDLDMADLDGQFLAAEATLEQHWSSIAPRLGAGPLLSYAFVNASHYPYARDEDRRPARFRNAETPPIFIDYVNAVDHVSRALQRFVERLGAADPDALIVVLGDHAPPLGPNLLGYRQGGRISADEPFPLRRAALYEVPLIVLDRGELVPVGRLPTYQIPYLLLDRLSAGAYCRATACRWRAGWRERPFRDFVIRVQADGTGERACVAGTPTSACARPLADARRWQLELLRMIEDAAPAS